MNRKGLPNNTLTKKVEHEKEPISMYVPLQLGEQDGFEPMMRRKSLGTPRGVVTKRYDD